MEELIVHENSLNSLYSEELLNFATNQVNRAISNAFDSLIRILSSPCISRRTTTKSSSSSLSSFQNLSISTLNRSPRSNVSIRCRSPSRNDRHNREISFINIVPRCSLPTTENDLVLCQSRLSSYRQSSPTRYRSSQKLKCKHSNRKFDVQYSFSLNQSWLTKINKQRHNLISIQNFVKELIEHSIRAAFLQIDYQNITNNSTSIYEDDTSCLLFDCSPSYAPIERFQTINSYIDQFIYLTIQQSIEDVTSSNEDLVQRLSNHLTEDVINNVISTITDNDIYSKCLLTDDEKHSRKNKKRTIGTIRLLSSENNGFQTSFFHQIRHRSSSAFRSITNNNTQRRTIDSVVQNIAQQIYVDTFQDLRQFFEKK